MKQKAIKLIQDILWLAFLILTLIIFIAIGKFLLTHERECVDYKKVIGVETQVVKAVGADDIYYHYEFEGGDKKVVEYKAYTVGETVCLKSIWK